MKVNSTSACPYVKSQPGQLLAVIECSDPDDPMGASLDASLTSVYKQERNMMVLSEDADIVLQRDHNSPSHFYMLLEHVDFVLPPTNEVAAPTYKAHVQCTNGTSTATCVQSVTFCIKHDRLIINSTSDRFNPATLFFTSIPRIFNAFPSLVPQRLFNVRGGAACSNTDGAARCMLREGDIECQIHSLSGNPPFVVVSNGE